MKKIGLLTSLDPTDKTAWSGIYFKIYDTLIKHGFEVEILGPYPANLNANRLIFLFEKIHKIFSRKRYYQHGSIINSFFRGRYFTKRISKSDCDIVLGITPGSEFAFLKSKIPLIYFSDTSFGQLSSYYDVFSDISSFSKWEANFLEKKALDKSQFVIFPSQWAENYVVENYKISKAKVKVMKMGANIDFPETITFDRNLTDEVKFLFLGVDWDRKGGKKVIDTLRILREKGLNVHLTVCGCSPNIQESFVEIIPFLNKNKKEDYDKIIKLLKVSNFLFVPTRAECYGIVFAEASAYGLPSISIDTGGVSSVIKQNVNGVLFKETDSIEVVVEKIQSLIMDKEGYLKFSKSTRMYFDEELDWKNFGFQFEQLIDSIA